MTTTQMNVVAHRTTTGAVTFQLIVPRRHPKLALNGSHYLLADMKRTTKLEFCGKVRDVVTLVKIWSPVSKSERRDEAVNFVRKRIRKTSPMLL